MSENSKSEFHFIKFTTSNWGENEYIFKTEPILYCQEAGIDLHVQRKIVEYMKSNNIKGIIGVR